MKTKVVFPTYAAKKLLVIALISLFIAICLFLCEYYTEASQGEIYFIVGLVLIFALLIFVSIIILIFKPIIIKENSMISLCGILPYNYAKRNTSEKRREINFTDIINVEWSSITVLNDKIESDIPVFQLRLTNEEYLYMLINAFSVQQQTKLFELIQGKLLLSKENI